MDLILYPPFLTKYFTRGITKYDGRAIRSMNHSSKEPSSNLVAICVKGTSHPADPLYGVSTANVLLDDFIPGFHFVFSFRKNENYRRSEKKVFVGVSEPNSKTMSIPTPACPSIAYTRQQLLSMRSNVPSTISDEVVRRLDFDNIFNRSPRADIINPSDSDVGER